MKKVLASYSLLLICLAYPIESFATTELDVWVKNGTQNSQNITMLIVHKAHPSDPPNSDNSRTETFQLDPGQQQQLSPGIGIDVEPGYMLYVTLNSVQCDQPIANMDSKGNPISYIQATLNPYNCATIFKYGTNKVHPSTKVRK